MALLASVVLIVSEEYQNETSTELSILSMLQAERIRVKIRENCPSLALCIVLYFIVYGIDEIYLQNYYGMPYTRSYISLTFMRTAD